MPSYVVLDTSIYRELGFKFHDNIDYINLSGFTMATDVELLVSTIVKEEFCNYFQITLKKKQSDYLSSINSLKRDGHFKIGKLSFPSIDSAIKESMEDFQKNFGRIPHHKSDFAVLGHTIVDALDLTRFILMSKNSGVNNVQVRDFLIWDSIIELAKKESTVRTQKFLRRKVVFEKGVIYFITKDKVFSESDLFQLRSKLRGVRNIEIFNSIPEFLHRKGFNLPFLTPELVVQKIKKEKILKDLSKGVGDLLSYVNNDIFDPASGRNVISSEIQKIEVEEYYSYKDTLDSKFKFVAHLKVYLKVVFEKHEDDKNVQIDEGGLNTFDSEGRPYFEAPILFIYRGLLDVKSESVKSVQFIDYLPFVYID